jgi:hypothetical protein
MDYKKLKIVIKIFDMSSIYRRPYSRAGVKKSSSSELGGRLLYDYSTGVPLLMDEKMYIASQCYIATNFQFDTLLVIFRYGKIAERKTPGPRPVNRKTYMWFEGKVGIDDHTMVRSSCYVTWPYHGEHGPRVDPGYPGVHPFTTGAAKTEMYVSPN